MEWIQRSRRCLISLKQNASQDRSRRNAGTCHSDKIVFEKFTCEPLNMRMTKRAASHFHPGGKNSGAGYEDGERL